MKSLKKVMSIILALSLSAVLVACGKNSPAPMQSNETDFTLSLVSDSIDRSVIFTNRDTSAKYDDNVYNITLKDNKSSCDNEKTKINGNTVTITNTGTYIIKGKLTDGQIIVNADSTDKIQLVLDGVKISCKTTAAINVIEAKKVFITTADNSENTLTVPNEFVKTDDNKADGVIYSKQDVTLNGNGTLNIESPYGHAVVCNDDLIITSGNYNLSAGKHCIKANDSISIAGGVFDLTAEKDTFHCNNKSDSSKGNIYIQNGDIKINAGDDAIHSSGYILIDDGNINISCCYEGIESEKIEIKGGNINLKASDDGLNASATDTTSTTDVTNTADTTEKAQQSNSADNDFAFDKKGGMNNPFDSDESCYINIAGGEITIDADGDGIDSNGYFQQTGGNVTVYGAENSGNSALDYGITAKITGGEIVAFGGSGMAQGFSSFSTQGSILVNFDNETTDDFVLCDKKGNQILSAKTDKKYTSVLVSTSDIAIKKTYKAVAGTQSKTIKMKNISYIDSTGSGKMFGGGQNGKKDFKRGDKPDEGKSIPQGEMPSGDTPPQGEMPQQGEVPPQGDMQPPNDMPAQGEIPSQKAS